MESFKVYRWDLPEDVGPLRANIQRLAAGELDVLLFTSAQQVVHLVRVAAARWDWSRKLARALRCAIVASVGPTTTEMLKANELPVDFEPSHPKLGHLISEVAACAANRLNRKRATISAAPVHPPSLKSPMNVGDISAPWYNSPFLRAAVARAYPTRRSG